MYARLGGIIGSVSGPFHPFGGAIDIVVVQQQDGTFKSSPWYVRFGKFQGVLKSRENSVNITVNGTQADFHMYLDGKGEAFFLRCTDLDADDFATSSPVSSSSSSSGDETEEKVEKGESEKVGLNEGQIVKRTDGRRSIFQLMFGRKSSKNRGDNSVDRVSSMERAEIAADLLVMKWSTNLSMKDRREFQSNYKTLEGQNENSRENGESASKSLVDNGESANENLVDNGESVESNSTILKGQNENSAENELEKVVKIQATEISNTEIELHEKSYTITEQKIISEALCVTGLEMNCTNLGGQNEINPSLNNCFDCDSALHVKTEEKITCIEVRETNQVIHLDPSETNKEKMLNNSEKNGTDYFEEREVNTNPKLIMVNSDSSDLYPPDSIDTSSNVSVDKMKQLEMSSGENISLLTNELELNQVKDDEKSGISIPGISESGMSNSENSEDLQFSFSDGEGKTDTETETNEREATESDNEEINTKNINQARTGSTRFESSPICIPSTSGTRNISMAISLPNLYYDSSENIERLSSSLGLESEVKRESHEVSLSTELVENCENNCETGRPDSECEKDSSINPLVELSLCKHLLHEGMGQEAAKKAFDSQKITFEKFRELGPPNLIKDQNLIIRIKNQYFPYDSAAPAVLSLASFTQENQEQETLELKGMNMIRVDQVYSSNKVTVPAGRSWWGFGFRRSRSVSSNLEEIEGVECKSSKMVRSLMPSSDELASLGLKEGCNDVKFSFNTSMLGNQQVDARIFLWKWNTKVVISDVDGTITKSDVLGQFMPLVGVDWSQTGVTHLFSAIKDNGYQLLFLSARAISQAHITRHFLVNLKQDGKALPDGPVVISPDGLFPSLYREVIRRAPHEFKISCLEDIKALFPADCNPFYAGFGNRDTDELSYLKVGIPIGKIFIINPKGQVAVNRRIDTKSYSSLHELVHGMFPPYSSPEQEGYNDFNFWRLPMREME
ncbi:hypothetical protein LUZ60_004300 [Juncus effusus]|nr:hypothetical protein LUZ60_004300 [Juncus effusus]